MCPHLKQRPDHSTLHQSLRAFVATLNFVPSIATMLFGVLAGNVVRSDRPGWQRVRILLLAGTFIGVTNLGRAAEDFGKRWELLNNSTKYYAACHLTHATIDAGRAIRARAPLAADAIESVRCRVIPLTLKAADQREPKTPLEAKFSVRYCAAMALLRGDAGEAEFSETSLADPAVATVMALGAAMPALSASSNHLANCR